MRVPAMRLGLCLNEARVVPDPFRTTNLAGEKGFEPLHAGIKIQCLNQLGDSPTQVGSSTLPTAKPTT